MNGLKWIRKLWDRRTAPRVAEPPVAASYWNGVDAPERILRNIGMGGAFIETPEKWHRGTDLHIRLITRGSNGEEAAMFAIWATVARSEQGGIGVQFIAPDPATRQGLRRFLAAANRRQAAMRAKNGGPEPTAGQALIEFALVFPLLFLLIVNVVNFGQFLYAWITVANAARAGAQYMIMGGATVTSPAPATHGQVDALVRSDLVSLPNDAAAEVRVCTIQPSSTTCTGTGGKALTFEPDPDSETGLYGRGVVDVTYVYEPLIPLWSWPALNIRATLPPTTIRAQSAMRLLQ